MPDRKIILNYIYNMFYQVITILIPMITMPYVSRILSAKGIGENGFTYSVITMFSGFCMFGIANYGSKSIAYVRDNKEKLTKTFWSIWSIQLIMSMISIFIYLVLFVYFQIWGIGKLFLLQLPWLIAALLDISWFFIGIEDLKKTVTRNILVKLFGLILIFVLVKNESDLDIYILINSISAFLGNIAFWLFLRKYINKFKISIVKIREHFIGTSILFLPQIAVLIYTSSDRIIIGGLSDMTQVGYYDYSQKVARIALAFVTSLSVVLMPRIANMYANKNDEKIKLYIKQSLHFTTMFSVLITVILATISKDFVPLFFGNEFLPIIPYMMLSSIIVIFISISGVLINQFAIPTGKNNVYIIPLVVAAITNISLNILLVPKLEALGGVISIICTEFIMFLLSIILVRKYIDLKFIFKGTYIYIIAGMMSFLISFYISNVMDGGIISVILEAIIASLIFSSIIFITNNPIREIVFRMFGEKINFDKSRREL